MGNGGYEFGDVIFILYGQLRRWVVSMLFIAYSRRFWITPSCRDSWKPCW